MLDRYVAQVRLLLGVLPDIATETVFALKGGTASPPHGVSSRSTDASTSSTRCYGSTGPRPKPARP